MRGTAASVLVLLLASCGGISLEPLEHSVRGEDPGSLDWRIPHDLTPLPVLDSLGSARIRGMSPLRRALLQRDLWMAFDDGFAEPHDQQVRDRLVLLMRDLALTEEEIRGLPDTFAEAARRYPSRFDADHPDRPFLPGDLFDPTGPWALIGAEHHVVASSHRTFFRERFSFLVFVRHPEGRSASIAFVEGLKSNHVPDVPSGMDFVLVRRTLLLNSKGAVVPSPITESVQIRHYHGPRGEVQSFGKFELRRPGLRLEAFGPSERKPSTAVSFEHQAAQVSLRVPLLATCSNCHAIPGGFGVQIFAIRSTMGFLKDLRVGRVEEQEDLSARGKMQDESWAPLEEIWRRLK